MDITIQDKLKGCLVGGAIGDSIGSYYESKKDISFVDFDAGYGITDDTQLTLATCESIIVSKSILPQHIAEKFLEWYNKGKLTGLGSSTLKALRDLQMGAHWGLAGRSGEYAAGNGAAICRFWENSREPLYTIKWWRNCQPGCRIGCHWRQSRIKDDREG